MPDPFSQASLSFFFLPYPWPRGGGKEEEEEEEEGEGGKVGGSVGHNIRRNLTSLVYIYSISKSNMLMNRNNSRYYTFPLIAYVLKIILNAFPLRPQCT